MIQMLMDGESDFVSLQEIPQKGDPQKMETDQESQSVLEPHAFARRFDGKKQLDFLSTHAYLFFEQVEKFMECSVCMSTTRSAAEMRPSTVS